LVTVHPDIGQVTSHVPLLQSTSQLSACEHVTSQSPINSHVTSQLEPD
jgi:hypothetical protein